MKSSRAALPRYRPFIRRIIDLGAVDAKVVKASSIVTAGWVRMKCRYGCDGYGSSLCCPPSSPTPGETKKTLEGYQAAILARFGPDAQVTRSMAALEREVFLQGHQRAFAFGAGPCTLCKSCPGDVCKHPEKARPSMEAAGIDVFSTVRNNGFPIEVVLDESSEQNYYGLLLVE